MLKGKLALISGGSRGIGKAIALALAEAGVDIALLYAGNEKAAEEACEEVRAKGVTAACYRCDVSDYVLCGEVVSRMTKEHGPVHILVNNAGIKKDKLLVQMKEEDFSSVLSVNLQGAFNLIRHTCGGFIRQREGRIINITSVAGLMGNAGQANYAAAKAGMIGLTKSVAKELAGRGVTCNAIAPGLIQTEMMDDMREAARQTLLDAIPMKRAGTAQDVATLAVFLSSQAAAYITGAVIPVDGGLSM